MRTTGTAARTTCPHCGATILPHRFCPKCKRYGELSLGPAESHTSEPKGRK